MHIFLLLIMLFLCKGISRISYLDMLNDHLDFSVLNYECFLSGHHGHTRCLFKQYNYIIMFIIFVISSVLSLDFMSINKHIVRLSTKLPINHKVSMFLVLPISIACQFRGGWFYNQGLSSHFRFFYKLSKLRETINVYGKKCYLDNVPTLPKEKEERVDFLVVFFRIS